MQPEKENAMSVTSLIEDVVTEPEVDKHQAELAEPEPPDPPDDDSRDDDDSGDDGEGNDGGVWLDLDQYVHFFIHINRPLSSLTERERNGIIALWAMDHAQYYARVSGMANEELKELYRSLAVNFDVDIELEYNLIEADI
jgi:hypothetical protein